MRGLVVLASVALLLAVASVSAGDGMCSSAGPESGGGASCSSGAAEDDENEPAAVVEEKIKKKEADKVREVRKYEYTGREETAEEAAAWEKLAYRKTAWTSEADWVIRDELDAGDELIADRPAEAVAHFEALLESHPASPRARYALGRALVFRMDKEEWSDERKAQMHDRVMGLYTDLLNDDEDLILQPVFNSAVNQGMIYSGTHNITRRRVEFAEIALSKRAKKSDRVHLLLVMDYIFLEDYEKALVAVERAEERFSHDTLFKLLKGFVLKRLGRKKEANKILRDIEMNPNDVFKHGFDVIDFGNALTSRGRHADASLLYQESSKLHLFLSQYQRPIEAVPDLESKPLWSLESDVGLTAHDEDVSEISSALSAITDEAGSLDPSEWHEVTTGYLDSGNWTEAPIFTFGSRRHHTCTVLPRTCKAVSSFAAVSSCRKCTAKLVRYSPGTHLLPHCGPTNARLRLHLPLRVPTKDCARMRVGKRDTVEWERGRWVAFDDSYEHEVWNECAEDVVVLSVDVPHPDDRAQPQRFNPTAKAIFAQM